MSPRVILIWMLRFEAVLQMSAIIAVLMPFQWMLEVNNWLGLEPLPAQPIVEYLARSLSAFYVWHGGITWLLSIDVQSHRYLLRFWAVTFSTFGVVLLLINLASGLPPLWSWGEGIYVIVFGIVVYRLVGCLRNEDQ